MLSPELSQARAVIITGGRLGLWALSLISEQDYLIGADRGAQFLIDHGFSPDLALGDFDSVSPEQFKRISDRSGELFACDAVDKDWTDTELAYREAVKRGFKDIVIAGALGTRFDHSLGNVHLLKQAHEQGVSLSLHDENNEIRLCSSSRALQVQENLRYPYISLLPLTDEVTGVTLLGFRYPLDQATLRLGWSLGISNVLDHPPGTISIASGLALVIRSRD
jgi:thiamine pyrophosphokinase